MLCIVELLIGLRFIVGIFGSDETISRLIEDIRNILGQMGYGVDTVVGSSGLEGPLAILSLIVGFMIFSYILITIIPGVVEKRSGEMEEKEEVDI
jgi:hypothetical protein